MNILSLAVIYWKMFVLVCLLVSFFPVCSSSSLLVLTNTRVHPRTRVCLLLFVFSFTNPQATIDMFENEKKKKELPRRI